MNYTSEESYTIIRQLFKFKRDVCDFTRNLTMIRTMHIENHPLGYTEEYIKGYNTAVRECDEALRKIFEDYANSRAECIEEVH